MKTKHSFTKEELQHYADYRSVRLSQGGFGNFNPMKFWPEFIKLGHDQGNFDLCKCNKHILERTTYDSCSRK